MRKTDAGLVWLLDAIENPRYRALVIRKNADDLADWSDRAIRMYHGLGAHIVSRPVDVTFPSGARIVTGHLKDDQAYTKYQGQEYQRILIEELTQIPDEKRYLQLLSSCRSTIPELYPQVFCSTNPGGVGHGWVKKRFIDPAPPGVSFADPTTGRTRIFIPSLVTDNPTLVDNDPDYVRFLDGLKDTDVELWKAWRLGDWNTFAGQMFREFRTDSHVCQPFIPKSDLEHVGGLDWGYSAPAVLLCGVFRQIDFEGIKFNRLYIYREVDGTEKTPEAWSAIYKQVEDFQKIRIYADPAVFNKLQDSSFSIADQFKRYGVFLRRSSNNRLSGITTIHNWLSLAPDGFPYMLITENCTNLIRTLPQATYDETKIEDVNQDWQDDHWCFCKHTSILTHRGILPIIKVRKGDNVWTPLGWSKVLEKQKTGRRNTKIFRGMNVTDNHPFLTGDGFLPLSKLNTTDRLWNVFTSLAFHSDGIQIHQDFPINAIFAVVRRKVEVTRKNYIELSGTSTMGTLQKVHLFIILMKTLGITIYQILRWSLVPNIFRNILIKLGLEQKYGVLSDRKKQKHGIKVKKEEKCTVVSPVKNGVIKKLLYALVGIAENYMIPTFQPDQNFVVSTVQCRCVGKIEVYNLKTDSGMYTAGDVVASNCDALRYLTAMIKWIDAKSGAFGYKQYNNILHPKFSIVDDKGRFVPLDPDKFGEVPKGSGVYYPDDKK